MTIIIKKRLLMLIWGIIKNRGNSPEMGLSEKGFRGGDIWEKQGECGGQGTSMCKGTPGGKNSGVFKELSQSGCSPE